MKINRIRRGGGWGRGSLRLVVILAVAAGLCGIVAVAPAPAQTKSLNANDDPNDPTASREERFRRQRALIMKKIAERREKEEAGKRAGPKPTPVAASPAPQPPAPTTQPSAPKRRVDTPHATIFLSPASFTLQTGEEFATQVKLLNPDSLPLDRVRILMQYPAWSVTPKAIHDDGLRPLLDGEPSVAVDEGRGRIRYEGTLDKPVGASSADLLTIVWQAAAPIDAGDILLSIDGEHTVAMLGERVVTAGLIGQAGGVSGAHLRVMEPASGQPEGMRFVASPLRDLRTMLAEFPDQTRLRPPTLWIDQPGAGTLNAGRTLVIDIGIDNPDAMVFDRVKMALRFNPEEIEVLDADRNNWIASGVNLLDGPFHKQWPWTRHIANEVDHQKGTIFYHMGMESWRQQPSGVVARIFVRVKRPVEAPILEWIGNTEAGPGQPATGVYMLNENVYLRASGKDALSKHARVTTLEELLPPAERGRKANPKWYRSSGAGS